MYSVLATIATGEVRSRNFIQIKITCHCNHYASVQILSKQLSPASRREGLRRGEGGSASRGGLPGVCAHPPPGLPTGRSASRGSAHPPPSLPTGGLHPGEGVCLGAAFRGEGLHRGWVCLPIPRSACSGSASGGMCPTSPRSAYGGEGLGRPASPPPWTEWHTGVKTLPCPKLHLWAVKSKLDYRYLQ